MVHCIRWLTSLTALAASGAALAHVGQPAAAGFGAGFAHPFLGLDHLLAMAAVGVWAAQLGGRALLALPAAFVAAMAAGAAAGAYGMPLIQVEGVIALSVLMLGMMIALAARARWQWAAAMVAVFALFHGHAHSAEMPGSAAPWLYFTGFVLATAALHALGVTAATLLKTRPAFLRCGVAAAALAGSWLLIAALT